MSDQSRKMSAPKKPTKPKRSSLLQMGPTPIRMTMMYLSNRSARKQFEKETLEYEKKKKAYDAAMEQLNSNSKKKRPDPRERQDNRPNRNQYEAK